MIFFCLKSYFYYFKSLIYYGRKILSELSKVITQENINNYDENGYTILWKMVKKGYNSVIKFLIEQGADLELKPMTVDDVLFDSSYEEEEFDIEEDLEIDKGTLFLNQ